MTSILLVNAKSITTTTHPGPHRRGRHPSPACSSCSPQSCASRGFCPRNVARAPSQLAVSARICPVRATSSANGPCAPRSCLQQPLCRVGGPSLRCDASTANFRGEPRRVAAEQCLNSALQLARGGRRAKLEACGPKFKFKTSRPKLHASAQSANGILLSSSSAQCQK